MTRALSKPEAGYPLTVKDASGWDVVIAVRNAEYRRIYHDFRQKIAAAHPHIGGDPAKFRALVKERDAWMAQQAAEYRELGQEVPSFTRQDARIERHPASPNAGALPTRLMDVLRTGKPLTTDQLAHRLGIASKRTYPSALTAAVGYLRARGAVIATVIVRHDVQYYLLLSDADYRAPKEGKVQDVFLKMLADGTVSRAALMARAQVSAHAVSNVVRYLRKRRGMAIRTEKVDGDVLYRIEE